MLSRTPIGKDGGRGLAFLCHVELSLDGEVRLCRQRQGSRTAPPHPSLGEPPAPAPAGPTGASPFGTLHSRFSVASADVGGAEA